MAVGFSRKSEKGWRVCNGRKARWANDVLKYLIRMLLLLPAQIFTVAAQVNLMHEKYFLSIGFFLILNHRFDVVVERLMIAHACIAMK